MCYHQLVISIFWQLIKAAEIKVCTFFKGFTIFYTWFIIRLYPVDKTRVNEYGQSFQEKDGKESKKTK